MSKWLYGGAPLEKPPEDTQGFIYRITHMETGVFYIGQKSFYSTRTVKLSKKKSDELWSGRGRKPTKQKTRKESEWRTYCSSSKEVNELIEKYGVGEFMWEVLECSCSSSQLDYDEAKWMILTKCLFNEKCLNQWLSLKVRRNNLC